MQTPVFVFTFTPEPNCGIPDCRYCKASCDSRYVAFNLPKMVDTQSRSLLAENIRHLVTGQITNYEFEEATFGTGADDRVIKDLIDVLWTLYDDSREHKLDTASLTPQDYKTFARFILFLKSGQEYKWPKSSVFDPFVRMLSMVFTLGMYTKKEEKKFLAAGDMKYWPFLNGEDFEQAKRHPKYLNGNAT